MLLTVRAAWECFSFYNTPSGGLAVAHYPTCVLLFISGPQLCPGTTAVNALNLQEAREPTAMPLPRSMRRWTPFRESHLPTLTFDTPVSERRLDWPPLDDTHSEEGLLVKHRQE